MNAAQLGIEVFPHHLLAAVHLEQLGLVRVLLIVGADDVVAVLQALSAAGIIEASVDKALAGISKLPDIEGVITRIRMESFI